MAVRLKEQAMSLFPTRTEGCVRVGAFAAPNSEKSLRAIAEQCGAHSFSFGPDRTLPGCYYGSANFGGSDAAERYLGILRDECGLKDAAIVSVEPAFHHVAVTYAAESPGADNVRRVRTALQAGSFGAMSTTFREDAEGRTYGLSVFRDAGAAQALHARLSRQDGLLALQF